jgi:hypothetical protein
MALAKPIIVSAPATEPLILNPAELRQLWQAYYELLELHRAEVVDDEHFEDAHRLLVEQVLPLRQILRDREHLVVDPRTPDTW